MVICKVCRRKKGRIKFDYSPAMCSDCFCRVIEKRIKKQLRREGIIKEINAKQKTKNNILLIDDDTLKARLNIFLLKKFIRNPYVKMFVKKIRKMDESIFTDKELLMFMDKNNILMSVLPWSCEDEITYYLKEIFAGRKAVNIGFAIKKHNYVFVKLLRNETEREISSYAKFQGIGKRGKTRKTTWLGKKGAGQEAYEKIYNKMHKKIYEQVERLEKKYPGTKFALLKSIDWIRKNI